MYDINVNYAFIVLCLHAYTAATLIDTLIDTLTFTPSPTVTHSPVMMAGVNVAAAVAIPVLLLLLLLVIGVAVVAGVSYYLCYHKRQGLKTT